MKQPPRQLSLFHWRRGGKGIPRKPRNVRCAYCDRPLLRPPSAVAKKIRQESFCSRQCQQGFYGTQATCSWPGCTTIRLAEGANLRRRDHAAYLCEDHTELAFMHVGSRRLTKTRAEFLNGKPMNHRRCGTNKFVRFAVFILGHGRCASCGTALEWELPQYHIDHQIPVWTGGKTAIDNLQLLCISCHKAKSSIEQKAVNATRWKRPAAYAHRSTHVEKDSIIADLLRQLNVYPTPGRSGGLLSEMG